jgi:hypothetical protein
MMSMVKLKAQNYDLSWKSWENGFGREGKNEGGPFDFVYKI